MRTHRSGGSGRWDLEVMVSAGIQVEPVGAHHFQGRAAELEPTVEAEAPKQPLSEGRGTTRTKIII